MKRLLLVLGSVAALLVVAVPGSQAADPKPTDVVTFVRTFFIEGLPYDQARRYGPGDVPPLVAMLSDPQEAPHWARAAMVLGIIGDQAAVRALIGFVDAETATPLSHEQFKGKMSAIASLGYAVAGTGNRDALAYLIAHVDPAAWNHTKMGASPHHTSNEARNTYLSRTAVMGLGLSGNAQARKVLQAAARTPAERAFRAGQSDAFVEALKINDTVSKGGLQSYYRTAAH